MTELELSSLALEANQLRIEMECVAEEHEIDQNRIDLLTAKREELISKYYISVFGPNVFPLL